MSWAWSLFSFVFLPVGYPESVAKEYSSYQLWDTVQQVVMFTNSNLAQLAVFGFHGVGRASASVTMAVVLTISRDLVGHHASLALSFPTAAAHYAARAGAFRMVGEIVNALAVCMDIGAFEFNIIWLFWGARMLTALYGVMNGVVRSCILQHFARDNNNRDIVLKEGNQDKAGKILGILGGVVVLHCVTTLGRTDSSWTFEIINGFCICLGLVHVLTNVGAVRALRVPPGTFVLQDTESRRHVASVGRGPFEATVDHASDGRAQAFKLANMRGGKALMTVDGNYVDADGRLSEDAVLAELTYTEGVYTASVAGTTYCAVPQARLAGGKDGGSWATMFVPPGFPATTPAGYPQRMAWDVVAHLCDMPRTVLYLQLYWRYVYGVGDANKSPTFATYLLIYAAAVETVAALVAGLPHFADHYTPKTYLLARFVGITGDCLEIAAALVPLHLWFPLVFVAKCFSAWGNVVATVVNAEVDRVCASHPRVDLAHISNTAGNRKFVLTLLSGALCMLYVLHLSKAGEEAQPPPETCIAAFALLQSLSLIAAWGSSTQIEKIVCGSNSDSGSGRAASPAPQSEEAFSPRGIPSGPGPELSEASAALVPPRPTQRQGADTGGCGFTLKTFALTLAPVLGEAAFFAGLVKTLSNVNSQLEPCTERCLQFKLMGDASAIPNTGFWPFALQNGDAADDIAGVCQRFQGIDCDQMPDAHSCLDHGPATCEHHDIRDRVVNPLADSRAGKGFIISTALRSIIILVKDTGQLMNSLGPADAVLLHVLSTLALACMAVFALSWASGAMELFFSPLVEEPAVCGCYFRMADLPSMLALSLPLIMVVRLRTQVILTMRAAIMGCGFLSTVTYHMPFHFVRDAVVDARKTGCLIGVRGLGLAARKEVQEGKEEPRSRCSMSLAKRLAKHLCWMSVLIILLPLLAASCSLVFRVIDLCLMVLRALFNLDLSGRSSASLSLMGVYGMIFLQGIVCAYFITETWRLYFILSLQLGDFSGDTSHIQAEIVEAHPEIGWCIRLPDPEAQPTGYVELATTGECSNLLEK